MVMFKSSSASPKPSNRAHVPYAPRLSCPWRRADRISKEPTRPSCTIAVRYRYLTGGTSSTNTLYNSQDIQHIAYHVQHFYRGLHSQKSKIAKSDSSHTSLSGPGQLGHREGTETPSTEQWCGLLTHYIGSGPLNHFTSLGRQADFATI